MHLFRLETTDSIFSARHSLSISLVALEVAAVQFLAGETSPAYSHLPQFALSTARVLDVFLIRGSAFAAGLEGDSILLQIDRGVQLAKTSC